MKSIFELKRNFPRVDEMRAAESVAVVEHVAMVCEVGERGRLHRESRSRN